jgi:hypothetical protein
MALVLVTLLMQLLGCLMVEMVVLVKMLCW